MFQLSNITFFTKGPLLGPQYYNPLFWFDASNGVTESGGLVSQWADKTGNGHDVSQTVGSIQPVYDTSGTYLNGYPTVVFGNGNVYTSMENTTSSLGSEVVNVMTAVVAMKTTNVNQFLFSYVNSTSSTGERRFTWQFALNRAYLYSSSTSGVSVAWNWPLSEPDYTPFVLTYRYDSSQSGINRTRFYVNGVQITSWYTTGGFVGISTTNTGFVLGNRRTVDNISFDGHIAELVFMQNITLTEQIGVEKYYLAKYNIS